MPQQSPDDFLGAEPQAPPPLTPGADQSIDSFLGSGPGGAPDAGGSGSGSQISDPFLREAAMYGGAALTGLESTIGLPGTIADWATKGMNWLTGANVPTMSSLHPSIPISGAGIINLSNQLGLTNRPDATPQNPTEKIMAGGFQGAGAGTVFGPAGAGAGALSGVVGEGTHELFPDSTVLPLLTSTAAGFGFGGLVKGVQRALAARAATKEVAETNAALAQATEEARNTSWQGKDAVDAVKDAAAARLEASTGAIGDSVAAHQQAVDNTIAGIARRLGPQNTYQEAGEDLRAAAKNWATGDIKDVPNGFRAQLAGAWAPVDAAMSGTVMPLKNFASTLKEIKGTGGNLASVIKLFRPSLPEKVSKALEGVAEGTDLSRIPKPSYYWDEVKELRTAVGDARGIPEVVEKIGKQNLSRLYAALTKDMSVAAKNQGPDALDAFNSANETSSRLFNLAEGPVSKILGAAGPESAAKAVIKGEASDLEALRGQMPDAINGLAAAHIRTNVADFGKLSPEARVALAGPDAENIVRLNAERDISSQIGTAAAKNAKAEHDAIVAGAKREAADANRAAGGSRQAAAEAAAAAKAKAAALSPQVNWPARLTHLVGGGLGGELALQAMHLTGVPAHLGADLGLGLTAATVLPLARMYVKDPALLRYPGAGFLAGQSYANELAAKQGKRK